MVLFRMQCRPQLPQTSLLLVPTMTKDDEDWPGLEQALKASEEESAAPKGTAEGRVSGRNGKGVVRMRRPASQGDKETNASAQLRLM